MRCFSLVDCYCLLLLYGMFVVRCLLLSFVCRCVFLVVCCLRFSVVCCLMFVIGCCLCVVLFVFCFVVCCCVLLLVVRCCLLLVGLSLMLGVCSTLFVLFVGGLVGCCLLFVVRSCVILVRCSLFAVRLLMPFGVLCCVWLSLFIVCRSLFVAGCLLFVGV